MNVFEVTTERGIQWVTADRAEVSDGYLHFWPETGNSAVAVFAPGFWSAYQLATAAPKPSDKN